MSDLDLLRSDPRVLLTSSGGELGELLLGVGGNGRITQVDGIETGQGCHLATPIVSRTEERVSTTFIPR
ncbi:hypothetical protein, partial [Klebsiella pneumoniae]